MDHPYPALKFPQLINLITSYCIHLFLLYHHNIGMQAKQLKTSDGVSLNPVFSHLLIPIPRHIGILGNSLTLKLKSMMIPKKRMEMMKTVCSQLLMNTPFNNSWNRWFHWRRWDLHCAGSGHHLSQSTAFGREKIPMGRNNQSVRWSLVRYHIALGKISSERRPCWFQFLQHTWCCGLR